MAASEKVAETDLMEENIAKMFSYVPNADFEGVDTMLDEGVMLKSEMSMETHRYTLLRNKVSKRYLSFCFAGGRKLMLLLWQVILCFTTALRIVESLEITSFLRVLMIRSQMQQVS